MYYLLPQTRTTVSPPLETLEEALAFGAEFVDAHPELFCGVTSADLGRWRAYDTGSGNEQWRIQAAQIYRGLSVGQGDLTMAVRKDGSLRYLRAHLYPAEWLVGLELEPRISAEQAYQIAASGHENPYLGSYGTKLVIAPLPAGEVVLAWVVHVREPDPHRGSWNYVVAAESGEVLWAVDLVADAAAQGVVKACGTDPTSLEPDVPENPPLCADNCADPAFPLRALTVDMLFNPAINDDTDDQGHFAIDGFEPDDEVCLRAQLLSRSALFKVVPVSGDKVLKILCGHVGESFEFCLNPSPSELTTSQINAFVWTERSRTFADYLYTLCLKPDDPDPRKHVEIHVNGSRHCTANTEWNDLQINFNRAGQNEAGEECVNTAYSSIVAHEFGHHFAKEMNKVYDPDKAPWMVQQGFDTYEGCADTFAIYLTDQSCIGMDLKLDGECHRDLSPDVVFPPDWCEEHVVGSTLAGGFWDLWTILKDKMGEDGKEVAERLYASFVYSKFWDEDVIDEVNELVGEAVIEIDDDKYGDGNTENGSPHKEDIVEAFKPHNLYRLPFVRGDANLDEEIDIADVTLVGQRASNPDLWLPCEDAADIDDNGEINTDDVTLLANYVFGGGPEPEPPFPGCGRDLKSQCGPQGDPLTCEESACPD